VIGRAGLFRGNCGQVAVRLQSSGLVIDVAYAYAIVPLSHD
jgi:hypothetical protein